MNFLRLALVAVLVFLSSPVFALEPFEDEALPPEKTRIIYEVLLESERAPEPEAAPAQPSVDLRAPGMTEERAIELLRARNITVGGKSGQRQFFYDGLQIFLLVEPRQNRLGLVTPVARMDLLRLNDDFVEVSLLQKLMKANYLATGYTRFSLNREVLWVSYLHPLDTLTPSDFLAALEQLTAVAHQTRPPTDQ
ncbi:MAG: hypothetical protein Kow0099_33360 [Candidatus Abyssubacteria bacterium]